MLNPGCMFGLRRMAGCCIQGEGQRGTRLLRPCWARCRHHRHPLRAAQRPQSRSQATGARRVRIYDSHGQLRTNVETFREQFVGLVPARITQLFQIPRGTADVCLLAQVLDQLAAGTRRSRGAGGASAALTGQACYQQQALRWVDPQCHAHVDQRPAVLGRAGDDV